MSLYDIWNHLSVKLSAPQARIWDYEADKMWTIEWFSRRGNFHLQRSVVLSVVLSPRCNGFVYRHKTMPELLTMQLFQTLFWNWPSSNLFSLTWTKTPPVVCSSFHSLTSSPYSLNNFSKLSCHCVLSTFIQKKLQSSWTWTRARTITSQLIYPLVRSSPELLWAQLVSVPQLTYLSTYTKRLTPIV